MNEILLPKTFGTIEDSEKEAVLLAIKEKKDVIYEFKDIQYRVTLAEARVQLPLLLTEALENLDNLIKNLSDASMKHKKTCFVSLRSWKKCNISSKAEKLWSDFDQSFFNYAINTSFNTCNVSTRQ